MLERPWGTSAMRSAIDLPVVGGVAGHEVEGHAHVLHRAAEHAQVAQALAGVVLVERELEPLAHAPRPRCGRRRSSTVGGVERAQRGAVVLGAFGGAVGGVVGHLVVVAGDALAGRRRAGRARRSARRSGRRARRRARHRCVIGALRWSSGCHVRCGTVGPAACRTRAAASGTSTPGTTGSTTFDGVRRRARPIGDRLRGTVSAANAHDGRLPPGGCTTMRIARAGAERVAERVERHPHAAAASVAGAASTSASGVGLAPGAGRSTARRRARAGSPRSQPLCT